MNTQQPLEPFSTNSFDMLIALAAVLALIFIVAWLMRRVQYGNSTNRQHLRVLSVLPMSGKERVVLIEVGSEQLLMGVSTAGIQHLHTLQQPIQTDLREATSPTTPPNFAESLRRVMGRDRS